MEEMIARALEMGASVHAWGCNNWQVNDGWTEPGDAGGALGTGHTLERAFARYSEAKVREGYAPRPV